MWLVEPHVGGHPEDTEDSVTSWGGPSPTRRFSGPLPLTYFTTTSGGHKAATESLFSAAQDRDGRPQVGGVKLEAAKVGARHSAVSPGCVAQSGESLISGPVLKQGRRPLAVNVWGAEEGTLSHQRVSRTESTASRPSQRKWSGQILPEHMAQGELSSSGWERLCGRRIRKISRYQVGGRSQAVETTPVD